MGGIFRGVKVGLALGGGAARGLSHLGVLSELEKAKIPIHLIAGTSIGAVIGGMYALDPVAEQIEKRFIDFLKSDDYEDAKMDFLSSTKVGEQGVLNGLLGKISRKLRRSYFYGVSLTNVSYLPAGVLERNIADIVPDLEFRHCKIPFSCCATDLVSRKNFYFEKGSVQKAILASCSIPGIFPPVKMAGMVLIDGSWAEQNPVRRARIMGADIVIAVDIMQDDEPEPEPTNSLEVITGGSVVTRRVLANLQLEGADYIITPKTKGIHWADFSKAEEAVQAGRDAASEAVKKIRSCIRRGRVRNFFTGRCR
ncbi:MAG: patatin-like phospholipase family protein [Nitrospinota bacterium]|nr:patatin-like phospholipase family protein [Nitrospinota bacterium]